MHFGTSGERTRAAAVPGPGSGPSWSMSCLTFRRRFRGQARRTPRCEMDRTQFGSPSYRSGLAVQPSIADVFSLPRGAFRRLSLDRPTARPGMTFDRRSPALGVVDWRILTTAHPAARRGLRPWEPKRRRSARRGGAGRQRNRPGG